MYFSNNYVTYVSKLKQRIPDIRFDKIHIALHFLYKRKSIIKQTFQINVILDDIKNTLVNFRIRDLSFILQIEISDTWPSFLF